ncbi:DUF444 family protein [Vibrio sp. PP-XX7]
MRKVKRQKSAVNRQRFLRRHKQQTLNQSRMLLIVVLLPIQNPRRYRIPDIKEPIFHQGKGGLKERLSRNDQFITEDGSRTASRCSVVVRVRVMQVPMREGNDDFIFQISKDEYLDILFDDLELPNLQKTSNQ